MPSLSSPNRLRKTSSLIAALLCLSQPAWAQAPEKSFPDMIRKFVLAPPGDPESDMLAKATAAVHFIQRMELPQASRAANEALQLAPRNSQLHFLNAFIYQLQAKQGDAQKNELAIEGYQQALRLDPGNWIAQEFLGLAYLDNKKFDDARIQFTEVLLMTPDSTVSIYGLMVASYLSGDAVTACAMADQHQALAPAANNAFARSSVAVYAACGAFDKAARMRDQLALRKDGKLEAERVDRRLSQWQSVYRQRPGPTVPVLVHASLGMATPAAPPLQLAQAFTVPPVKTPAAARPAAAQAGTTPASAPVAAEPVAAKSATAKDALPDGTPRMVLVDVVLVSAQELVSTAKGINLLNALTLQLGAPASNLPAYSRVNSSNAVGNAAATVSTAITRAVTVPALAYSLNIANANNSVNEVLARPTLAAIEGMPSEFFSGTNLSAGVVSASVQGGTTVVPLEKRFGIKLAVTPTFLPDGKVQLKVESQRTSLNANVDNPKVAYQIEMGEITANANVVMNMGDTLVLSGLSEKSTSQTRDGVPLLQDIPVLQYLFSTKRTTDIQRSVLILVTPRAPAYTARADASQDAAAHASLQALRDKFGFGGSAASNADAVLSHLKEDTLFREFRQGDVTLERWERMDSTGERLRQALEFLYF